MSAARFRAKVLLIQGDPILQRILTALLEKDGYRVLAARTGDDGVDLARRERPDIVLIDPALAGMPVSKLCQILKKTSPTARGTLVLLSDGTRPDDIAPCLRDYADDYIAKPFDSRILLAHLKAILRRKAGAAEDEATEAKEFDGLTIRADTHEVLVGGRPVGFTKTEFDILSLLAGKPNQVFTRSRILDHVRADDYSITERVVDFQVAGIRKKLGPARACVQTVRGVGYKFRSEPET